MDSEIIKGIIDAAGTIAGALIVGVAGGLISRKYSKERDKQDKESQWRNHAIELTKLDMERKIKKAELSRTVGGTQKTAPIRPSILDFLANYRDLKELDHISPGELYKKILSDRINPPVSKKPKKPD